MAYNVKWYSEFADEQGNEFRTEVLERDYSGEPIKVLSGSSPFVVELTNIDNPFQAFRPLKYTVEWIAQTGIDFTIGDVFIADSRKYKIRLSKFNESGDPEILFHGYLVPINCEEPFQAKPYPVQLSATCGLPFLRDDYFLDQFGSFVLGKISIIKVIANCLASTGHDLPIHTYINLFEQGMVDGVESALQFAEIDADGLRGEKAHDVLVKVLNTFRAFIVQSPGAWIIKSVKDQNAYLGKVRKYSPSGDFIGYSLVGQSASIGREPYSNDTPNLRPKKEVDESIAEQNSIVTVSVNPGIPVNRMPNGSFSGNLVGGQLPGWDMHLMPLAPGTAGAGWTRSGFNTPDDPFKIDMTGYIPTIMSLKSKPLLRANMVGHILLDPEVQHHAKMEWPKYKVIISGAYRSSDISFFQLFIRLNDGDKRNVSYLNSDKKWVIEKRRENETFLRIDVDVPVTLPNSKPFSEALLQTFEIEVPLITDYLERDGKAVAHLYFSICAAQVAIGRQGEFYPINPRLTWEDFSIIVTTETVFEGEHKYSIDAKFPIRNPNKAEYEISIGDKIGIDTPEQRRPVNRVMTGYMTLAGGDTLTKGWKRAGDADYEPIQKSGLRDTVRLLCGKRRIIQGVFKGYGLLPDHSVFSRYDSLEAPTKFFTITGWRWNVKNMEHTTTLHGLVFDPLPNEVIDIVSESEGRRGNRLYSGSGGSGTQGGTGAVVETPIDEIVVDDIETFQYISGKADTIFRICDLGELILSSHFPFDLTCQIIYIPDWITEIIIYTGEDLADDDIPFGGMLQIKWKGKPSKAGKEQIVIEIIGANGEDAIVRIPIQVNSVPKIKFSVVDTTIPKTLGGIPGAYKLPDVVDVSVTVTGYHNNFQMEIYGPSGLLMDEFMYADGGESELQTYRAFPGTDGIVPEEGLYKIVYNVQSNLIIVDQGTLFFTLYTDEYLSKLKFELWNESKIGDISIQDTSIFKPVVWFTPRAIADDIEHDKVTLTLYFEGDQIAQEVFTHTATFSGTYDVYDTAQTGQDAGNYRINAVFELAGDVVMERQNDFVILAKEPVADGTIVFGTMTANTANFTAIQDLPVTLIEIDLPDDGYNFEYTTVGGDYVRVEFLRKISGVLSAVDLTKYTNQPDYTTVSELGEKVYVFRTLSSLEIGDLHEAPSTVKVRVTERLGGATGTILSIAEANINFRVPVDPADLGGLVFMHINNDNGDVKIIDPNMKKVGNIYALPKMPWYWSVAFLKLPTGLDFDRVVGALELEGVDLNTPGLTSVFDYMVTSVNGYPGNITNELNTVFEAFVEGVWVGTHRMLHDPSDVEINIDVTGSFKYESVVAMSGVPIAFPSAEFELVNEEDLPETPEEDGSCCEPKRWYFTDELVWDIPHNMDGYPEFNLIIAGQKWENGVDYPDTNNAQVTWKRPRTGFAETK